MGRGLLGTSSPGYGSGYGVADHPDAMSAAGPLGALGIDWGE